MAKRGNYTAIDIHKGEGWPKPLPELTEYEAERAFRRLWRFSTGKLWGGVLKFTTGNRAALRLGWEGNFRCMFINPSQGWDSFVHYLSHIADDWVNGTTSHNPHHMRFEAKLIREVIKRGWLEGKLKRTYRSEEPESSSQRKTIDWAAAAKIADNALMDSAARDLETLLTKQKVRAEKLKRVEARLVSWQRKLSRAQNAIAKLERSQRGLVRHLQ